MRNFGVERALRVARTPPTILIPYVVGFSMAGDEANFPAHDFAEAYPDRRRRRPRLHVHAGEWAGPESVRAALTLPVTRIDHGVRAIEDPSLVAELAEREIVLNSCPDEQRRARACFPSFEEHPLPALRDAGVKAHPRLGRSARTSAPRSAASIGSARSASGSARPTWRRSRSTAIDAAFCDGELKAALRSRL